MRSGFKYIFCYVFLLCTIRVTAQEDPDSLLNALKTTLKGKIHDTMRVRVLADLAAEAPEGEWQKYNEQLFNLTRDLINQKNDFKKLYLTYHATALDNKAFSEFYLGKNESAIDLYNRAISIQIKLNDEGGLSTSHNGLGQVYDGIGEIPKAIREYSRSIEICRRNKDLKGLGIALNNLAICHYRIGNVPQAIEGFSENIRIKEQIGMQKELANVLRNLGAIYYELNDYENALSYFRRSLNIALKYKDDSDAAYSFNNIGLVLIEQKKIDHAEDTLLKALHYTRKVADLRLESSVLNNLGNVAKKHKDHRKALELTTIALKLSQDLNDMNAIALQKNNMAVNYYDLHDYTRSEVYARESLGLSREHGYAANIRNAFDLLYKVNRKKGNYAEALRCYEQYILMRDSISNEKTRKASVRSQLKYEYEKQAAADSVAHAKQTHIKNAELKKQAAEINAKRNQQYALFGGLALIAVFSVVMFNRYKVTNNQKKIIELQKHEVEEQKEMVEEKQKEILDSIRYAKRIQLAQIPSEKRVSLLLKRLR